MNAIETSCGLAAAVGRQERCPGALCAYWERPGGRAERDGCALHGIAPHLKSQPELARYLVALRAELEAKSG
jgi:hypothetical protein